MNLNYKITTVHPDKLKVLHIIVIDAESLTTTKAKEVLQFAKNRAISKHDWKELKESVRLGNSLSIR